MRRVRHSKGSVLFDKGRGTWRFLQWTKGKRRSQTIGTKQEFATKAAAWREVERLELLPRKTSKPDGNTKPDSNTMKALVARYEAERFPVRHDTAQMYRSWLKNHILPKWGDQPLPTIQPSPVELWLRGLDLAPKSKTHVRSIMHSLFEFAMFAGVLELGRNPISLVRNPGATQKVRQARNLTVEQFQALLKELPELSRLWHCAAQLCVCASQRHWVCDGETLTGLDRGLTSSVPSSHSMSMQPKLKAPRRRSASLASCWNVCVYGSSLHNFRLRLIGFLQVP